jgi:purine-nucleoside phosphorylase
VEAEIRYEIKKLKRAAAQVNVSVIVEKPQNRMQILCSDKKLRNNLIASVYLSSAVGFSYYLITFYIKYFKGNIFVNFASIGVADAIGFVFITKLTPKYNIPEIIRILLVGSIISAIVFMIT